MDNRTTALADGAIALNLASSTSLFKSTPPFSFISSFPAPSYYTVALFTLISPLLLLLVVFFARTVLTNVRLHFSGLCHVPRPSVGAYSLVTRIFRSDPVQTADWINSQFSLVESPLLYITGPLFASNILISTPSAVRTLSRGVGIAKGIPFIQFIKSFTGPGSIFTVEGAKHVRLRRAMSPTLTHHHITTHCTESFFSEAHKLCERLLQNSGGDPLLLVRTAAFRVVVDACFGKGLLDDREVDELFEMYHSALNTDPWLITVQFILLGFPVRPPYHLVSRSERARRKLRRRVQDICERAISSQLQKQGERYESRRVEKKIKLEEYSLLYHMVMSLDHSAAGTADGSGGTANDSSRSSSSSSSSSSSKRMSASELTSNVLSFLIAGQATTTLAVTWILYLLGKHTEWQTRLHDEICSKFDAEGEDDIEKLNKLGKLPILYAIIKETLRLYPPLMYTMRSIASEKPEGGLTLDGYFLPNGTQVRVPVLALQTAERVWGKDAKIFNPQRWIDDDDDGEKKFMWATFWFGNHGCIGQRFAMLEMKVFVLTVVRKMRISVDPAKDGEPTRWGTNTMPKNLKVYFESRESE